MAKSSVSKEIHARTEGDERTGARIVQKALEAGDIRTLKTDFDIPARSVDMCTLREVTPTAAATAFMEMVRQGGSGV